MQDKDRDLALYRFSLAKETLANAKLCIERLTWQLKFFQKSWGKDWGELNEYRTCICAMFRNKDWRFPVLIFLESRYTTFC